MLPRWREISNTLQKLVAKIKPLCPVVLRLRQRPKSKKEKVLLPHERREKSLLSKSGG
jgi:hypothetical protein